MSATKKYILEQVARRQLSQDDAKAMLTELAARPEAAAPADAAASAREEIAIVGMACRFPMADDAEAYWRVLADGLNCIRDFPAQRKQDFEHILRNPHYTEFLIGDAVRPEDVAQAHAPAGYLDEIDKFDAAFFGIPPTEATFMDPHQRLALAVAWEAMEDAGYGGSRLSGSNTGIYLGKEGTNYSLYRYTTEANPMKLTGSWESIMVSRISYLFDFKGPCMLVDTACSAGLVSVHMAAQAILNGECDQAIAGGINLSITGEFNTRFQGSMSMDAVESRDATIRTFDARANGTVWGEGVAMVMLKPLSRALADGDHIHAVIKGSALNNDGAASGLTAPDAEAQEAVIVRAWDKAGIDPATLSYIEAHGTGTVLGDPIEFKGLTAAFRRHTTRRQFCAIGSLKTNMGHLVAASGVASLFKVVKSLQHRKMAPTINFDQPNPYIGFVAGPLYVNDALRDWEAGDGPRRAALSSFGFSHTNCHMVVEEAPPRAAATDDGKVHCFTVTAHSAGVLRDYLMRHRAAVARDGIAFADACHTTNIGRGHYPWRVAIVAGSLAELREGLDAALSLLDGKAPPASCRAAVLTGHHTVVSDRKKTLDAGEITEKARKELGIAAAAALDAFLAGGAADRVQLAALARLYADGADVDWTRLHAGTARRIVPLPTYPFQRIRVWAGPKISRVTAVEQRIHPLVERLVSSSAEEDVFESTFRTETHWVLSDHRIKGAYVVPGTTYLEMARAAARAASHASRGWDVLELRDVFFLVPMVVEAGESRRVRIRVGKSADALDFAIESLAGDDGAEWQRHVEGRIVAGAACELAPLDAAALQAAATETIAQFQAETDTGVFQFGPHWDAVRSAWRLGEHALARLSLQPQLQHELQAFELHPSVLDNAVNLLSQGTGHTYLPFTYKSFRVFAPFTATMYSHVISKTPQAHTGASETMTYDIVLADADGRVLAAIGDYVVKKVRSFAGLSASGADGEYLAMRWSPLPAAQTPGTPPRRLLLLGAAATQPGHDALAAALQAMGIETMRVALDAPDAAGQGGPRVRADDDGFAAFCRGDALAGVDGIVFLASAAADGDAAAFRNGRTIGVDALFRLTKALLDARVRLPWGLAVLTRHAFAADGSEAAIDAAGAAAAALGSVIGMEYAGLPCRLVDAASSADDAALARHLLAAPAGRQTALRNDGGLVRELHPLALDALDARTVRDDGVYLVTGGLGGLGLATARFLAGKARARVVLAGRSAVAPRGEWETLAAGGDARSRALYGALLALSPRLDRLECVACDIADEAAVQALVQRIRAEHGPLRGVFHLAGVAGDGFLVRKDFTRFDAVLRPKLDGTRHLQAAVAGEPLDWFACFSSVTALTGGEGQGDYAAANAFLDAWAWQARRHGIPAVAINWPGWKEIGMAAAFGIDDTVVPFVSLAPADAFERLDRILAHAMARGLTQVLPSTVNAAGMAPVVGQLPFALAPELQRRMAAKTPATMPAAQPGATDANDVEVAIRGKNEEDLTPTETALAKIYAAVLGLAEIDVFTNFHDMGGNSIIATHLLKLIDAHFPDMVDISDIFSYASIDEMAAYVDDKRARSRPAAAATGTDRADLADMLDSVLDGDGAIDAILDRI